MAITLRHEPRVQVPEISLQRLLVCLEAKAYKTEDGIWVLPALEFAKKLAASEVF